MRITPVAVLGGAALAFLVYKFTQLRRVGRLIFFPGSVHSFSMQGQIPVIQFNLSIQNTSSQSVVLRSVAGNLFADGVLVGNISSQGVIEIPANGSIYTRVAAQLSFLGIVNSIIDAIQDKDTSKVLMFEGFANVDDLQVPVDLKLNLGV